jgi:hypothetical protein
VCAGNRKLELKDLRKLARERGGKCLSREYMNGCAAYLGVQTWTQVESGGRAGKGRFIQKRNLVPQMLRPAPSFSPCRHDRADENPGQESRRNVSVPALSGLSTKLLWRCGEGDRWYSLPGNIKGGNWCPICAGNRRLRLKDYRVLAAEHGGKCFSRKYSNNDTELKWRCSEGHEWLATGSSVKTWASIVGTLASTIAP